MSRLSLDMTKVLIRHLLLVRLRVTVEFVFIYG